MSKNETPIPASPAVAKPTVVTLDTPIIRGEQRIETVELRKPSAGELRGVNLTDLLHMDVTALHTVLPRITNPALTQHDVSQMDLADLAQLASGVAFFLLPKAAQPGAESRGA